MDSFELNKIAGAVLGTLLFAMGLSTVAGMVLAPKKAGEAGYALPEPAADAGAAAGAPAAPAVPLAELVAKADPARGQKAAAKCASCHTFDENGPNRVGPNLHGALGRQVASHEGFNYSGPLKSKGGTWSWEDLNAFIESPRRTVPGTSMAFAGISNAQERADLLAYLKTLSPNAPPPPTQ